MEGNLEGKLEANLKSTSFASSTRMGNEMKIRELIRSLGSGECVISAADSSLGANRTIIARIRPRATMHGGVEV